MAREIQRRFGNKSYNARLMMTVGLPLSRESFSSLKQFIAPLSGEVRCCVQ